MALNIIYWCHHVPTVVNRLGSAHGESSHTKIHYRRGMIELVVYALPVHIYSCGLAPT